MLRGSRLGSPEEYPRAMKSTSYPTCSPCSSIYLVHRVSLTLPKIILIWVGESVRELFGTPSYVCTCACAWKNKLYSFLYADKRMCWSRYHMRQKKICTHRHTRTRMRTLIFFFFLSWCILLSVETVRINFQAPYFF